MGALQDLLNCGKRTKKNAKWGESLGVLCVVGRGHLNCGAEAPCLLISPYSESASYPQRYPQACCALVATPSTWGLASLWPCLQNWGSIFNELQGNMNLSSAIFGLSLAALLPSVAAADVYYSDGNWGDIIMSGPPWLNDNTVTFGESFTLTKQSTLNTWSFWLNQNGYSGNARFEVAQWNGSHVIGSVLYRTEVYIDGSDNFQVSASQIGLNLEAGSYIAILTTAGVPNRVGLVSISATMGGGNPLPGGLFLANTAGIDPIEAGATLAWRDGASIGLPGGQLRYRADITSAVPEPGASLLSLCGMFAVFSGLRRSRSAV